MQGFLNQVKIRQIGKGRVDNACVFFRFKAAGTVDESTAAANSAGSGEQQSCLEFVEFCERGRIKTPAGFGTSMQYAGV
jgi:hypothetical protein